MYSSYDQPYEPPQQTAVIYPTRKRVNWAMAGAYFTAALGLGIAIMVTALFFSYKGSAATQVSQLRHEVATARAASASSAGSYNSLNGKVSEIAGVVNGLAVFGMTCSQYLTGPGGGPATFYFPCSDQKAGG